METPPTPRPADPAERMAPAAPKSQENVPPRPTRARYVALFAESISLECWAKIIAGAVNDSLTADQAWVRDRARRFLAEYLIGKPIAQAEPPKEKEEPNLGTVLQDLIAELPEADQRALATGAADCKLVLIPWEDDDTAPSPEPPATPEDGATAREAGAPAGAAT